LIGNEKRRRRPNLHLRQFFSRICICSWMRAQWF
jgi:hypothetical protein